MVCIMNSSLFIIDLNSWKQYSLLTIKKCNKIVLDLSKLLKLTKNICNTKCHFPNKPWFQRRSSSWREDPSLSQRALLPQLQSSWTFLSENLLEPFSKRLHPFFNVKSNRFPTWPSGRRSAGRSTSSCWAAGQHCRRGCPAACSPSSPCMSRFLKHRQQTCYSGQKYRRTSLANRNIEAKPNID